MNRCTSGPPRSCLAPMSLPIGLIEVIRNTPIRPDALLVRHVIVAWPRTGAPLDVPGSLACSMAVVSAQSICPTFSCACWGIHRIAVEIVTVVSRPQYWPLCLQIGKQSIGGHDFTDHSRAQFNARKHSRPYPKLAGAVRSAADSLTFRVEPAPQSHLNREAIAGHLHLPMVGV